MNPKSPDVSPETAEVSAETSFGDILNEFEASQAPEPAGPSIGTVVSITDEAIYVDLGRKMDGAIPVEEYRRVAGDAPIKVGDTIKVNLAGRDAEGNYRLSLIKAERPKDWSGLEAAFAEKRNVVGVVTEIVKGGARVDIGMRAFMPASRSGTRDQAELEKLVGQEIQCRITKLDKEKDDLVVDRRIVLEEAIAEARQKAFEQTREGAVVKGTVRNVTDFGAFVDLGGFDGLLHVTDMAWNRIAKPSDVVKPGDTIEVKVLKVNRDTRKISLGLKQLQPDPWSLAGEKYRTGDRVKGRVSRLTDFGAFVELEPGVEGLIHLSEMSWTKRVRKPADVLRKDETVEAVVLGVNPGEKRISLGLKQALGDPWEEAEKKYAVGTVVEAPVTNLAKFGAFVDLGDGIEGMIHIGDMSREKRLNHPNELLKEGQVVKAQVLEMDRDKRRIRLGMRQLEPTAADNFIAENHVGETVTGRVVDVSGERLKVELGEGVHGVCRLAARKKEESQPKQAAPAVDVSAVSAMLAAKWKTGGAQLAASEGPRAGQIRKFRIAALDPQTKRIELELAD
jgi:small subunit ribosomal protein S1